MGKPGKIAGGNVIVLPREILDLTGSSSSEEIFATFGGIDKYKDLLEKLSANNYLVQIGEPSLGSLRHIYTLVEYSVKFASNKQSGALSLNIYNEDQQLRRLHFYLEDNALQPVVGSKYFPTRQRLRRPHQDQHFIIHLRAITSLQRRSMRIISIMVRLLTFLWALILLPIKTKKTGKQ